MKRMVTAWKRRTNLVEIVWRHIELRGSFTCLRDAQIVSVAGGIGITPTGRLLDIVLNEQVPIIVINI